MKTARKNLTIFLVIAVFQRKHQLRRSTVKCKQEEIPLLRASTAHLRARSEDFLCEQMSIKRIVRNAHSLED